MTRPTTRNKRQAKIEELFQKDEKTGRIKGVDYTKFTEKIIMKTEVDDLTSALTTTEKDKILKYQHYKVKVKDQKHVSISSNNLTAQSSQTKKLDQESQGTIRQKESGVKSATSFFGHEHERLSRHGIPSTICFNLTSQKAIDEGWIINPLSETDILQSKQMKLASSKLRENIREREMVEEQEVKKSRFDEPVEIRYYGDSRHDIRSLRSSVHDVRATFADTRLSITKNKSRGAHKVSHLVKPDDHIHRQRFSVHLPDGSTSVYYPGNGELALLSSAIPSLPGQFYVHCYANDAERTCLGMFTPYGKSTCYHKNGATGMSLSESGGIVKSESGTTIKKWQWPKNEGKLKDPVSFTLNKEMFVRAVSFRDVTINFNSSGESTKLQVGAVRGCQAPSNKTPSQMILLQSDYSMTLKTAADFGRSNKTEEISTKKSPAKQFGRKHAGLRKNAHLKRSSSLDMTKPSVDLDLKQLQFESQADHDLVRLRNKSKILLEKWMSKSRALLGMSSPSQKKLSDKPRPKTPTPKAKSAKGREVLYVNEEEDVEDVDTKYQSFRCPSAPPRHMLPGPHSLTVKDIRAKPGAEKNTNPQRLRTGSVKPWDLHSGSHAWHKSILSITSSQSFVQSAPSVLSYQQQLSNMSSPFLKQAWGSQHGVISSITSSKASQFNMTNPDGGRASSLPTCDGCPAATRRMLLNITDEKNSKRVYVCKCRKKHIPMIYDLEFDYFLHMVAPPTQLIVIFVVNSLYPRNTHSDKMLNDMYILKNKNRNQVCLQSRYDRYRMLRYDVAIAKSKTYRSTPLLLGRHNAVPGMAMMYCGGRLVFADHIFNGYGNAKKDFLKQVMTSRMEFARGHFLPDDFRFTPDRGKTGFRAAWGGEMRGAGVNGKGEPGMFLTSHRQLQEAKRQQSLSENRALTVSLAHASKSDSDVTSSSLVLPQTGPPAHKRLETAKDFIHFSLSTLMYTQPQSRRSSTSAQQIPAEKELTLIRPKTTSTYLTPASQSILEEDENTSFTLNDLYSYVKTQSVK